MEKMPLARNQPARMPGNFYEHHACTMEIISLIVVIRMFQTEASRRHFLMPVSMRPFFLASTVLLCSALAAAAQTASSAQSARGTGTTQERIALSTKPENTPTARPRLACAPLDGQVFDPNGQPLLGATLLIKGTHQVYVTDSEGKFLLTDPVYQGQTLTVQAAGYNSRDIALVDCTIPRLVLEKAAGARFKRSGKRAGQVIRLDRRSTNLK
jgi:CarboxypepD_reg-like domain